VPESRELRVGAVNRAQDQQQDQQQDQEQDERHEIARLEAEIALRRQRVGASFEELHRRLRTAISWRHWAASHPAGWIGVGVSLGFIIGCLAGRRSPSEP
jgi:ElaB/YqjD/DUF883 family membrane-anchored ribosome-binding protein